MSQPSAGCARAQLFHTRPDLIFANRASTACIPGMNLSMKEVRRCALCVQGAWRTHLSVEVTRPSMWTTCRRLLHSIMHALNGNGRGSFKGRGHAFSGKGKSDNDAQEEVFLAEVRSSMPEAAKLHMIPTLVPEEWSVPTRRCDELSSTGGVAVVHRTYLPSVLRAVGYTHQATACLTRATHAQAARDIRCYPTEPLVHN